jgi:hypothetical protein
LLNGDYLISFVKSKTTSISTVRSKLIIIMQSRAALVSSQRKLFKLKII